MKSKRFKLTRLSVVVLIFTLLISAVFNSKPAFAQSESKRKVLENIMENENVKARILWYDLSANLENLNSPEKVKSIVKKTADANINTIVLDVKSSAGFVPYDSEYSPHLSESNNPKFSSYPKDFDLIEHVTKEAKKYNIAVHININTFSAGSATEQEGPAIDNPDWQTVVYDVNRVLTINDAVTLRIHGFNRERLTDELIIFTPEQGNVSPSNRWGVEVAVENNVVIKIADRNHTGADPLEIPDNGYVISANGSARHDILDAVSIGDEIDITQVETNLKKASEVSTSSVFMNPIHPEVQQFTWNVIGEIIENYDIAGITLDRARYNNQYTDFSDLSREKFEESIGQKVENWPEDILRVEFKDESKVDIPGPLYNQWIKWRAANIESYFKKTREKVKALDNNILFNTYVGSWYPLYYSEGVNWGSKNFKPTGDEYWWISEDYHETGFAEHLDFLMTGLYFKDIKISDLNDLPDWYSVEGSANMSMQATNYETFTYGSLYLLDYQGSPDKFEEAIRMADSKTHGTMLFDLVYLEMYDGWWDVVKKVFSEPSKPPHTVPEILELVNLVEEAAGYSNDDEYYTEESFENLRQVIDEVLKLSKSESDFSILAATLSDAISDLEVAEEESLIDISELEDLIAQIESITNENNEYTESSYASLMKAVTRAKEQIELIETDEQLSDEIMLLLKAMDGLVETVQDEKTEKEDIDLTQLKQLIKDAKTILEKANQYTKQSIAELETVVENIEGMIDDVESEDELQKMISSLESAINNVKLEQSKNEENDDVNKEGENKEGELLPKTATPLYNTILIGLFLLVMGAVVYFINIKRKESKE